MRTDKLAPVGLNARTELSAILAGLGLAVFWSLAAPARIVQDVNDLTTTRWPAGAEIPVTPYRELLGTALDGFFLVALVLISLALGHYLYHRRGARTDYLMRRLPQFWEYHLRCLALPVLGIVLALGLEALGYVGYRALYRALLEKAAGELAGRAQLLLEGW